MLRDALRQWRTADTGKFTQSLSFGPVGGQTTTGVYQLSSRTSSITQATDAPDGQSYEFRFVGIMDVSYMNAKDWPANMGSCWLRFDGAAVERATGMTHSPGAGGLPANAIALSYARGMQLDPADPDSVIGTVDLPTAAMMFGSGVLKLFDDPAMTASVEAEFTLDDGKIDSWRVSGGDLVAAMDREGLLSGVSDELREGLEAFEVEVEYQHLGSTEVDVRPPARSLQMTPEQMDARQGCPAAR